MSLPRPGPLAGVRVLDLSRLLPGPACTWFLQGMGARVDRVETPGKGDWTRSMPPFLDSGIGAWFAAISRGKRSLALELRSAGAPGLLRTLLPHYDVLVEGFRPGVMEAMGLAPERLVEDFPGLVVARISGYGQTGPWADRPGHDINYVGLGGLMAFAPHLGAAPAVPHVQVADFAGAMVAAAGVAAALFDRERSGLGRVLDVSMTEAAMLLTAPFVTAMTAEGREPRPGGEPLTGGVPLYGTYLCADGRWLTLGALEPKFQHDLLSQVGPAGLADLAAVFATRPRDEWVELLQEACSGPALQLGELADHPQLAARGAVLRLGRTTWVRPPLGQLDPEARVPGLGEHTDEILAEIGLMHDEIAALRQDGVVA